MPEEFLQKIAETWPDFVWCVGYARCRLQPVNGLGSPTFEVWAPQPEFFDYLIRNMLWKTQHPPHELLTAHLEIRAVQFDAGWVRLTRARVHSALPVVELFATPAGAA